MRGVTLKKGCEKAAAICRLLMKYIPLKESEVEHLVYREDGEVNVAIRTYRKLKKRDEGFVKDVMDIAGLTEIEMARLPDESNMMTFYSVLKKS